MELLSNYFGFLRSTLVYGTGTRGWCDGDVCGCHASRCHTYIRAAVSHKILESDQIWHHPDIDKYSASASHLQQREREREKG